MSAIVQQEDVADSGKDDENNLIAAAPSENAGNPCGDAPSSNLDENLNSDKPDTDATGDIPKPVSLEELPGEKPDDKIADEANKGAGDSEGNKLAQVSSNKTIDSNKQKDNIETEITAKDSLDNTQSIANITNSQANINLDIPMTVVETGYKETVLDDVSDTEFELRWSGDENDDEMNAEPLTDEVMKRLEEELGLADTESSKETTQKIITIEKSTIEIEKSPELVDKKSSETLTLAQNLIDTDEANNETDVEFKQVKNNEPDSHPIQELLDPIESGSVSITTELEIQSNKEAAIAILKELEEPMDVDIASVESELPLFEANTVSDGQSLNNKTVTDLVKEINVVEENKISEIDVDETIMDLQNLIDQDEDTIKQLGLDVQKSDDKNKQTAKPSCGLTSVEETKSTEVNSASIKIEPMDEDISTEKNSVTAANIVKDELNLEIGDILSTKESNSNNIEENDNKKDDDDDKKCIQKCSQIVFEECPNIKTEELTKQKDKGDTEEPPTQNAAKTDDNIENYSKQKAEEVICKNIDNIDIFEAPKEPNLDEHSKNISIVKQEPGVSNDLIKINTDHRINRPDVMLDIPTQEFDFDDFDDDSEMQAESDKTNKNDSDLTTKTVTEIVNQLAKEPDKRNENQSEIATTDDVEMTSVKNISDTTDIVEESESTAEKPPATHKDNKTPEKELSSVTNDNKSEESSQKDDQNPEKDSKSTENIQKPDINQPSTSTESTKDTPNKIPTTLENDKLSEVGLKTTEKVVTLENDNPQQLILEAITEELPEDRPTDSLGLLAEATRVTPDDFDYEQEPEEDQPDEGDDDDDDFDPDDEENSNQTEAQSEDGIDSNDNFDTEMKVEIDIEPTQISAKPINKEKEEDTKSLDSSEKGSEKSTDGAKNKEFRSTILAKLLTKPAAEMSVRSENAKSLDKSTKKSDELNIVEIEGIFSDDDSQENKDISQELPSVAQEEQQETSKMVTVSINEESAEELEATEEKTDTEKDKFEDEVFNLDSDEDDEMGDKSDLSFIDTPRENNRCINYNCTSDDSVLYYQADRTTMAYYGAARRLKRAVCKNCVDVVTARNEGLVSGIKDLRPLMALRMSKPSQLLLEISDSDSEGEDEPLGEDGAKIVEGQLTDMINEVWTKYNMDERLKETQDYLEEELERMQKQSAEVDKLLRDCQKATDELRFNFYNSFEGPRHELPGISIHETPIASYTVLEAEEIISEGQYPLRYPKRRSTSAIDVAAKRLAVPSADKKNTRSSGTLEDDKDVSVVNLSAETAPDDLPPPGEIVKPPLMVGAQVYAMKNQYGSWLKGKVLEILPKINEAQFTSCRIKFEHKVKNSCKVLTARSVAYAEPSQVRMTIGTRVIALFRNADNSNLRGENYYSGLVAEVPNPVNLYRYLVFFDDGYAQYVEHKHTRLVYESKTMVWEEVQSYSRDFVHNYLMNYPERPMVRMHPGQEVNVERDGKWWVTKVLKLDASLVHVQFPDRRTEWIYRGTTRLRPLFMELQAAKQVNRQRMPRSTKANTKTDVPYVEYIRSDDQPKPENQSAEDLRRQRAVAKKSTTIAQQMCITAPDNIVSRVVFYSPRNSMKPLAMVPHTCGPHCKRSDVLTLNELRSYNPLTKPLLCGWERATTKYKTFRLTSYRAPCGRRVRTLAELHAYLRAVRSELSVDLFDFHPGTHCLAEFVLNGTNVQKKDLSLGQEVVPIPSVNYYDHSMPQFCTYMTERKATEGVPLNLDPEFLCGCDCEDDCADKSKCACWQMTLEGAKTIGMTGPIGYHYRRLPEPLPTGIYECNSRCKCKSTCLNRVVQNRLQIKLQVFKTLNRGWGIRALNDVPKGTFICIYAGNLLTDATANLDGLNEGDEYLAELDFIEVVEGMKEGYEEDLPEKDKELDKKEAKPESEPESEPSESEEEETLDKQDIQDGDFQPGNLGFGLAEFNKRLRIRDKNKVKEGEESKEPVDVKLVKKEEEGCITISDDEEEYREPSRFAAQESMTDNKVVSKYRSVRSYFGKDEACYIMDAKVQGNIGRYLNHSCSPNVFVQNVFVDTHDPRFPWVSFFALHHIRAGTELTWNYNYDIGSVPGKVLYCYCGAANCRGRLL